MFEQMAHIKYERCPYAQEYETICRGLCGLCKFPEIFGNKFKKFKYSTVRFFL